MSTLYASAFAALGFLVLMLISHKPSPADRESRKKARDFEAERFHGR
jgi:hypothetical protein